MMTKMTKRVLASMLSVVMCVSLVSTPIKAQEGNTAGENVIVESEAGEVIEEQSEVKTEETKSEEAKSEASTEDSSKVIATKEVKVEEPKEEIIIADAITDEATDEATQEATKTVAEDTWDQVTTQKQYISDNCEITFILAGHWATGYTARVLVKNTTDKAIHDWYVQLDTEAAIDQIWNAEIKIHEDDTYAIKNVGWNQDIKAGDTVEFSYAGNTAFEKFPTNISLLNVVNNNKKDFDIEYVVINEGGSSYVANINITNNTESTLEEWILEFDFNREISGMWNGVIENQEGNHFIVRNSGYNGNIAPGQTITIGFVGNDELSGEEPFNYKLISAGDLTNEEDEEVGEKIDFDKDSDKDGLPDYIESVLGTDKDNADTDGDGISDYDEIYVTFTDPLVADADGDLDGDGLTNAEELALGTSTVYADTDEDGLSDYDEVNKYGTNPLKADTDGDGVNDGKEVSIGTDPTLFDKEFTITVYAKDEDTVKAGTTITLTGSQVNSLSVSVYDNDFLFPTNMPGYIGGAYDYAVDGTFDKATVTFEFDKELLNDSKFDPVIYYFDEENQELLPLETVVSGNVASTTVPHFSKFILLNRTVYEAAFTWQDVWTANSYSSVELVLAIDASGSMSSTDKNYQRLDVAKNLIDALPTDSKVGLIKFETKTTALTASLTEDRDEVKNLLNKTNFKPSGTTVLYKAIESSLDLFTTDEGVLRIIVILSDGSPTERDRSKEVIPKANAKGVKLYTVGLGSKSSSAFKRYLQPLSDSTDAKFYLAADASELNGIFKDIVKKIDIETDSDADGISDYYEENLVMFNGVTLVLDKNNPDTDGDGILDGKEVAEIRYKYNEDKTKAIVTGKVLSNPLAKDTDYDGVIDSKDPAPMSGKFIGKMTGYYDVADAQYTMDFRKFFKSTSTYSTKLSSTSLALANTIYYGSSFAYTSGGNGTFNTAEDMLKYHGFESVENYKISASDDDISEMSVGINEVTYNGTTKKILAVVVRGTNGTIQEWSSNFDMGDPSAWSSDYHKGFYLTEDRLHTYLKNYVTRNVSDTSNLVYWITGHSRGAALGNLMAGRLVDEGKTVVAYTFATPNITIKSNVKAAKYSSIHSIVNKRDVVTYLPASQWGFTTYGNTYVLDLGQENLTSTWTDKTGQSSYNALESNLIDTAVKRIVKSCAGSWDEVFDYAGSQNIDDAQYAMFSDRAKRYAKFTERKSIFGKHKGYKVYPSLALFFQFGAECIGGSDVEKSNVGELMPEFWNSKFAGALLLLIGDVGFNNSVSLPDEFSEALVGDGHALATYYVLVNGSHLKDLD